LTRVWPVWPEFDQLTAYHMLTRGSADSLSRIRVSLSHSSPWLRGWRRLLPFSDECGAARWFALTHGGMDGNASFAGASWTCLIEASMVASYGAVAVAKSAGGGARTSPLLPWGSVRRWCCDGCGTEVRTTELVQRTWRSRGGRESEGGFELVQVWTEMVARRCRCLSETAARMEGGRWWCAKLRLLLLLRFPAWRWWRDRTVADLLQRRGGRRGWRRRLPWW